MSNKVVTKIITPIGLIKKIQPKTNQLNLNNKTSKQYKKRKSFNLCFYDFGKNLEDGINSFTKNEKYKNNLSNDELVHLQNIKYIANKNIIDITKKDKINYLYSLNSICSDFKIELNNNEIDGVVVPASGGNIIANCLKIKKSKIIPINCKRIQLKEKNNIGIGMNIDLLKEHKNSKVRNWYLNKLKYLENKNVIFLEISVASGLTTLSFLLELITNNVKPKKIKLITPFLSIKGLKNIEKFSNHFNFNIEIKSKLFIEKLGDYWNGTEDSLLDEENKFIIGKVSNILKNI